MTTLRSIDDLEGAALLEDGATPELEAVAARYAVAITPVVADLIRQGAQGISAQFLPDARELQTTPDESPDPIGDHPHSPVKGLVHRYPDRVLIKALHACRFIAGSASAARWSAPRVMAR